jgi:hypothetical protein
MMLYDTETVEDAVMAHGEWNGSYPAFEKLIGHISPRDREIYAESYRLTLQLERLKAVSITRQKIVAQAAKH